MGVTLLPREGKVFDEVTDIVDCDMVIVMDRFDHEEVRCCEPKFLCVAGCSCPGSTVGACCHSIIYGKLLLPCCYVF